MCVQTGMRQQKCPVICCKNVNTGKFHFSNKDNFCQLIWKMRNGVVVFVLVVPAAVVGIGNVSYGLRICRNGESFDLPLCALEEWWGERGTGKNPRLGFRILAASLATVLHLDLILLCSFHTHSLDSDHTERHRGLWLMILGEKNKQINHG